MKLKLRQDMQQISLKLNLGMLLRQDLILLLKHLDSELRILKVMQVQALQLKEMLV